MSAPDWVLKICCRDCLSKISIVELMERGGFYVILCLDCGNKRCPKAQNHIYKCTGSNAVGQVGEVAE